MNINTINTYSSLISDKLNSVAVAANQSPIDSATTLIESEAGVKMAAKVIKTHDEMLGTVIDLKA